MLQYGRVTLGLVWPELGIIEQNKTFFFVADTLGQVYRDFEKSLGFVKQSSLATEQSLCIPIFNAAIQGLPQESCMSEVQFSVSTCRQ